jgi:hypothetical protein
MDAAAEPQIRSIVLLRSSSDGVGEEVIAEGPGLGVPAAASQASEGPILAWVKRGEAGDDIFIYSGSNARSVRQSRSRCSYPSVAEWQGSAVLACQEASDRSPIVRVWRADGEELLEANGRRPQLAVFQGSFYVLYESHQTNGCDLVLVRIDSSGKHREFQVPRGNDLNFHASITADEAGGVLYIAHEAALMWGADEQLGRHRDLYLWKLLDGDGEVTPGPDTASGLLPVPPRAHSEWQDKNATPLTPLVRLVGGRLVVLCRRFREHGVKSFGWDIYRLDHGPRGWSEPVRISENFGTPDTPYDFLPQNGGGILLQPCCEQLPCVRVNVDAPAGYGYIEHHELLSYHPGRPYDFRVEVRHCDSNKSLPEMTVLKGMAARYGIPPRVYGIGLEPPLMEAPRAPKYLLWGDLHVHTTYSKCVATMDGTPEENLRFQRDHLGCRVLCLTEHTHIMSQYEVAHSFDLLESEAGLGCVPIYATEPLTSGEDTIFYSKDRETFERLRVALQMCRTRPEEYRLIKEMFPLGSVLVARHFDGPGADEPGYSVESFDPDIERLMEAMQVRGDSLMGELFYSPGLKSTNTASKFLNAGKRVGLTGGTDHCEGYGANHLCLTGIWVDEITPDAVWDAMWNRRTVAVSKGKLAIWSQCEGAGPGEEAHVSGPVRIQAWVSCATPLRRVCLIRDGEPLAWQEVSGNSAQIELIDKDATPGEHWYSVTAEAISQFHGQSILGHASPIFVQVDR